MSVLVHLKILGLFSGSKLAIAFHSLDLLLQEQQHKMLNHSYFWRGGVWLELPGLHASNVLPIFLISHNISAPEHDVVKRSTIVALCRTPSYMQLSLLILIYLLADPSSSSFCRNWLNTLLCKNGCNFTLQPH
ncbi:hypothetical protein KIL84_017080 [Mauremys mutica]|uniref:Uncharacterized protein n=1 Tax=Mauremys mutica TaxID=74926 RepID=A0A9D3X4P2_9SAUR|nr:hypothetical protein KIL84_017080 [Mauremys mutica]